MGNDEAALDITAESVDVGKLGSCALVAATVSDEGTGVSADIAGAVSGDVLDTAISGCLFTGVMVAAVVSGVRLVGVVDEAASFFLITVALGTECFTVFGAAPEADPAFESGEVSTFLFTVSLGIEFPTFGLIPGSDPVFTVVPDAGWDVAFVPDSGLAFDAALEVVLPDKSGRDPGTGVELAEDVLVPGPVFCASCLFSGVAAADPVSVRDLIKVVIATGAGFLFVTVPTAFFTGFGVVLRLEPVFDRGSNAAVDLGTEVVLVCELALAFDIGLEDISGPIGLDGRTLGATLRSDTALGN